MEPIIINGKEVAYFFAGNFTAGTNPLTNPDLSLQILSFAYDKGRKWPAHFHKKTTRQTDELTECMLVLAGQLQVQLSYQGKIFYERVLSPFQAIMVTSEVALALEALDDVKLLEFKNGPYIEDKVML